VIYKHFQENNWSLFLRHRRIEGGHNTLIALLNKAFPALRFDMHVNDDVHIVDAIARLTDDNIGCAQEILRDYQIGDIITDANTRAKYLIFSKINDDVDLGRKIQSMCYEQSDRFTAPLP